MYGWYNMYKRLFINMFYGINIENWFEYKLL